MPVSACRRTTSSTAVRTRVSSSGAGSPRSCAVIKAARSLNELGGGRFVLGLGVAHQGNVTMRGHEYGRPVATMRAYLDAMDEAEPRWRGPEAAPAPRVLAALRPRMLALAAERTAGAH